MPNLSRRAFLKRSGLAAALGTLPFTAPVGAEAAASGSAQAEPAWHLVNRLGYGPRPEEVARARQLGAAAFVEEQLAPKALPGDEADARQAITLAASTPDVQAFLAQYPDWRAEAYADDEGYWHVDFYDGDEIIGYTHVYLATGALNPDDTRLPERLSAERRAALEAELKRVALSDAEVAAILGEPEAWEYGFGYDLYRDRWSMYWWRGLERLTVEFDRDGERFTVARFYDPSAFDEAEARRVARDQALALAYGAPGIDAALAGYDDWRAYAEEQGEGRWSVEFAAGGERLITVLVDVARGQVLGTEIP